jgi:hypothetical protein
LIILIMFGVYMDISFNGWWFRREAAVAGSAELTCGLRPRSFVVFSFLWLMIAIFSLEINIYLQIIILGLLKFVFNCLQIMLEAIVFFWSGILMSLALIWITCCRSVAVKIILNRKEMRFVPSFIFKSI